MWRRGARVWMTTAWDRSRPVSFTTAVGRGQPADGRGTRQKNPAGGRVRNWVEGMGEESLTIRDMV